MPMLPDGTRLPYPGEKGYKSMKDADPTLKAIMKKLSKKAADQ